MTPSRPATAEVWFLTGSQGLYGAGDPRPGRRAVPGRSPAQLDARRELPVRVVWKPVLLDAAAIHRQMLGGQQRPASASA